MNFRRRQPEELDINLAPLIDVVFLLLIFFMVSTTFDHQSELAIDLPQAQGKPSPTKDKIIDISIDKQGAIYIDKQKISSKSSLREQLKAAINGQKDPKIIISADKLTPHQAVMNVLDNARQLGVRKLTFAAVLPQ